MALQKGLFYDFDGIIKYNMFPVEPPYQPMIGGRDMNTIKNWEEEMSHRKQNAVPVENQEEIRKALIMHKLIAKVPASAELKHGHVYPFMPGYDVTVTSTKALVRKAYEPKTKIA